MKLIYFNEETWLKSKRKANTLKYIILFGSLSVAAILFGIRDNWFSSMATYCWEDYLLYLVLTVGLNVAALIKNSILGKSQCIIVKEESKLSEEDYGYLFFETAQSATFSLLTNMIKERS